MVFSNVSFGRKYSSVARWLEVSLVRSGNEQNSNRKLKCRFTRMSFMGGDVWGDCEQNQTLFIQEGSSAVFNVAEVLPIRHIIFTKHNVTETTIYGIHMHGLSIVDLSDSAARTDFLDPWMENRTEMKVKNISFTTTIHDVQRADNGTYVLQIQSIDSFRSLCFALFVIGINRQQVGSVEEYRPAYFFGYPKSTDLRRPFVNATMTWLVDGKNCTYDPQFIIQDGMIWIASLQRALNGKNITYRAVQDNGATSEANYTIEIKYGPEAPLKFSPNKTQYFLKSGETMPKVSCSVECNPACTLSWGERSGNNILSLGKVSTEMAKEYVCTATRPDMDITVYRSLTVHVTDESAWNVQLSPNKTTYLLSAGENMPDILCTANCHPPCEVTWGVDSNTTILSLGKVSTEMSGEYACTAMRNDTERLAVVKLVVFVQDNSLFTIAIAVLASIQTVTTILLGLCGLFFYRKNNALPCRCLTRPQAQKSSVIAMSSAYQNNLCDTDLDHYEELDSESRNKAPTEHYELVQAEGKTSGKSLEVYENTKFA